MYDLHADLLLWLEQARQDELQRKVALQALLRQAQMDSRWTCVLRRWAERLRRVIDVMA